MSRFEQMVSQFKAYIITEELIKHGGHIGKTAASLGIHRNSLSRNLIEHNIDIEEIKKKIKGENNYVARAKSGISVIAGGIQPEALAASAGSPTPITYSESRTQDDVEGDGEVLAES